MDKELSIPEAFSHGYLMFKKHGTALFPSLGFFGFVIIFFGIIIKGTEVSAPLASHLFNAAGTIIELVLMLGLIHMVFALEKDEKISFKDLFAVRHLFFRYFFAIIFLVIAFGVLCIIPAFLLIYYADTHGHLFFPFTIGVAILAVGVFFMTRLKLMAYVIVAENKKTIAALKRSWQLTKGNSVTFFAFVLLAGIFNLVGAALFLIGLLVTVPITLFGMVYVYKQLAHNADELSQHEKKDQSTISIA